MEIIQRIIQFSQKHITAHVSHAWNMSRFGKEAEHSPLTPMPTKKYNHLQINMQHTAGCDMAGLAHRD